MLGKLLRVNDSYQLAIIGAGPAGLAAAGVAAGAGVEVALFDEQPAPGGQIFRAIESSPNKRAALLGPDYMRGAKLVDDFRQCGAAYFPETSVWSINSEREIGIIHQAKARLIQAQRIIVTGGAMERPIPFQGWTLPGVMNAGAAQVLMKSAGVVPDTDVVLAGKGPLLLLLAWQYARSGVKISAILDVAPLGNWFKALRHIPKALLAGHYITKGLVYKRDLHRLGVKTYHGVTGLRASGDERLAKVKFTHQGKSHCIPTALLLTQFGIVPNTHLTMSIACKHYWNSSQMCWCPSVDEWGNTSVSGIAVAGDSAAIGGAVAAEHAGRLAALEALWALGKIEAHERDSRAKDDRSWMRADLRIRPFLEALYRPPQAMLEVLDDDVIVCRCEEITAGEIRKAIKEGHHDSNQVKFFTRTGMGACQGRQCGNAVAHIISHALSRSMEEVGHFRIRPPIKPISLSQLSDLTTQGESG